MKHAHFTNVKHINIIRKQDTQRSGQCWRRISPSAQLDTTNCIQIPKLNRPESQQGQANELVQIIEAGALDHER